MHDSENESRGQPQRPRRPASPDQLTPEELAALDFGADPLEPADTGLDVSGEYQDFADEDEAAPEFEGEYPDEAYSEEDAYAETDADGEVLYYDDLAPGETLDYDPDDYQFSDGPERGPVVQVPVNPEFFSRRRRKLVYTWGTLALILGSVGGWIYKRQTDPLRAAEAFDSGQRLLRINSYQEAILSFDRALSLQPEMTDAYLLRGRAHAAVNRLAQAIPDFTTVLERRPDDAEAYYLRGSAHLDRGDLAEAVDDFTQAVTHAPEFVDAYNLRGVAFRTAGQNDRALEDFNRALEIRTDLSNYYERGATYLEIGDYERAISDFTQAINFQPLSPQAYFARAQAHRALGDYVAADRDHDSGRILDGR